MQDSPVEKDAAVEKNSRIILCKKTAYRNFSNRNVSLPKWKEASSPPGQTFHGECPVTKLVMYNHRRFRRPLAPDISTDGLFPERRR
ncbi:hypothetical protein CDAR_457331 [Caerostris darwini]|uniref:Uncharacterized protein n=1 Tax=Caerostris darwini TaxID=1538125 RepID=A0AAV4PH60_9ARAC|nr:hypothetical protein CDAR_457331 [Caerostris darwini]